MNLHSLACMLLIAFLFVNSFPVASCNFMKTAISFEPVFQKGMSFATYANMTPEVYGSVKSDESLSRMKQVGVEWVAINVVGWYQTNETSEDMHRNASLAPTDEALAHAIMTAHSLGMKVMLKPMIDLENGVWRGEIQPSQAWFENYADYIDFFAEIAEQNNVEMFCVGTEFEKTVSWETSWRTIISDVRKQYSGLLTYAADWSMEFDEYVKWWDAVDYVGIDAYFPLSGTNEPTLTEMNATWRVFSDYLDSFHSRVNKPIIFTEIGYLSTDGTNKDPSNYKLQNIPGRLIDLQEQADCYEAAFQALQGKSWFYGFYWWFWQTSPDAGGSSNSDYTPQNKPAEGVLTHWYSLNASQTETSNNDSYLFIIIGISLVAAVEAYVILVLWRKLKSRKNMPKG